MDTIIRADSPLDVEKIEELEHIAIFGFDGTKPNALKIHENHLIFPLGCRISIINIQSSRQEFLCGHSNTVSAIDISNCGRYVASGQVAHTGFRATVILWKWRDRTEISRYQLHTILVEGLCFTADSRHLISLGGQDDGKLIVWSIEKSAAVCGAFAKKEVTGPASSMCPLRKTPQAFLTCGEQHLRLWQIDASINKMSVRDVSLGKLRRYFTTMIIGADDAIFYAGTTSGDVVKVNLNCSGGGQPSNMASVPVLIGCYGRHNPKKAFGKDCEKYANGVRGLLFLRNENELLIGAGDGLVELVEERKIRIKDYPCPTWPLFKSLRRRRVNGRITSLQTQYNGLIYIGTDDCEIYTLDYATFQLKLQITCNSCHVYDIAFPNEFSLVFATASYQSVRVWSLKQKHELLRIVVPNFSAAAVLFSFNGLSIITAWNDGAIRAFTPLTGKLIYAIPNAHNKGCSALAISSCDRFLVSGGCEGQIRVWKIEAKQQKLMAVLKEHTAPVGSLQFNCFDREVVSSSSDGTCIIWDMARLARKHVLSLSTQFTCAQFFPSAVQILATGTDRKISYWEVYDGSLVREVDASAKSCVNCLSINKSGEIFVTAGADQIVKLWDFQTAILLCAGTVHAASIISCKFSPCGKYIVSGSVDGTIIIWKVPEKYWPKTNVDPLNVPAIESVKKLSKYDRRPEDIKNLSRKTLQIFECSPISASEPPHSSTSKIANARRK